ncbi:hypothetical protein [Marinobacter salicampi]|uniref:hypothetical protein n=1 Tax=Marinobacter salicampi TaxID=435907 RepID=UPI001408466C|nr:hypothetical protein [Marinobacter salicampi]
MKTELTEAEEQWIDEWLTLINKMPQPLMLMIDAESADGSVGVYLPPGDANRKAAHTRWINRINGHLGQFPEGDGWLLSNVDGWHFGKGNPTVVSSPSYGVNGACSSHSDDYEDHYCQSVMIPYGQVPQGYEWLSDLDSNLGSRDTKLIISGT